MLAAVILSGGASTRMGSPKALLKYQGRTFLEHLLEITVHPRIGTRRVVLGPHADEITKAVALGPEEVVMNPQWELGQLSSLHAALRSLPESTDGLLLCLIDHPLVSGALVGQLIDCVLFQWSADCLAGLPAAARPSVDFRVSPLPGIIGGSAR